MMTFFMAFVVCSIVYVSLRKQVVHYMGTKKAKAELYAFVFSTVCLVLMGLPSMHLLYKYRCLVEPLLVVKVTASQ